MQQVQENKFQRIDGTGETVEIRTTEHPSELLAYIDYSVDGAEAAVDVFYPYKGTSRSYKNRTAKAAEAIVERHLKALNYTR